MLNVIQSNFAHTCVIRKLVFVDSLFIVAPIAYGDLVWSLFCNAVLPFYFCNHLDGEKRAGCFNSVVFLMSVAVSVLCTASCVGLQCEVVVFPCHIFTLCLVCIVASSVYPDGG